MKFCSLVLELHLPQNFCHTHTETHRQADIFQKQSNCVQDLLKHVNPSKPEIKNLHETNTFSIYIEESKN